MGIIRYLMQSRLGNYIRFFRDIYLFPGLFGLKNKLNTNERIIILAGTPLYNNLGDHLIVVAEKTYLNKYYPNYKVVEIPRMAIERIKSFDYLSNKIPVLITGGGWLGDIWEQDDYIMQDIIRKFKNNPIIMLPQTVYYKDILSNNSKKILSDMNDVISKCSNIELCFRDLNSYEFATKYYNIPDEKIHLIPDMALFLVKERPNICMKKKRMIMGMREDRERSVDEIHEELYNKANDNGMKIVKKSTLIKKNIPSWKRKYTLNKLMKYISTSKIVVTDRLHMMVLCLIGGTKCIVFDNLTHKVSGVIQCWLNENRIITFMDEKKTMEQIELEVNEEFCYDLSSINEGFGKLNKIIDKYCYKEVKHE